MWLFFSLNKMGKIAAGVAHAELKYLSFMVALIPGLASSWIASRTANSLPRMYAVLLLFDLLEDEGNISAMRRAQDAHEIARLIRKYI